VGARSDAVLDVVDPREVNAAPGAKPPEREVEKFSAGREPVRCALKRHWHAPRKTGLRFLAARANCCRLMVAPLPIGFAAPHGPALMGVRSIERVSGSFLHAASELRCHSR
jgi:hypothetical protein